MGGYMESYENRFADKNVLGVREGKRQLGQLFKGAGRTTPPGDSCE